MLHSVCLKWEMPVRSYFKCIFVFTGINRMEKHCILWYMERRLDMIKWFIFSMCLFNGENFSMLALHSSHFHNSLISMACDQLQCWPIEMCWDVSFHQLFQPIPFPLESACMKLWKYSECHVTAFILCILSSRVSNKSVISRVTFETPEHNFFFDSTRE